MNDERPPRERDLDEAIDESFPASDPPANTVETGTRVGPLEPEDAVVDNRDAKRFELTVDGQVSVLTYDRRQNSLVLQHTEVPESLRGHHIGDRLAKAAIDAAHAEGLTLVVLCPFVKAYLRKHPQAG